LQPEDIVEQLGLGQSNGAVLFALFVFLNFLHHMRAYPKFAIIFHEGECELEEAISHQMPLKFRMFHLLHLEDIG